MSNLKLNVRVDSESLYHLQASNFSLCLTKDVHYAGQEQKGNVVFSMVTSKDLGPIMSLEWAERYQVYGTNEFQAGAKVTVGTSVANIKGGQKGTMDANGDIEITGAAQPGTAFSVDNQWKQPAAIGVNNFDAASGTYATIFVTPLVPRPSTSKLLPIQKYSVFWDVHLQTNTMFQHTSTPPFPFDLTSSNEITLQYQDGIWSIP